MFCCRNGTFLKIGSSLGLVGLCPSNFSTFSVSQVGPLRMTPSGLQIASVNGRERLRREMVERNHFSFILPRMGHHASYGAGHVQWTLGSRDAY